MDIQKYTIHKDRSLFDALGMINDIGTPPLTLIVVDDDGRMVGTLTDGDIRRGILRGLKLDSKAECAARTDFRYLRSADRACVSSLKEIRRQQISLVPVLDADGRVEELIDLGRTCSLLPVDAVLMAGGKGERLRPLTADTPKPLLKVGQKAIIDHNVDRLISYGIKNINVTVNYLKEQIEHHFSHPVGDVMVRCVPEPRFLGTIGSVKLVDRFANDTVLVMNSDLFTDLNYEDFYLHFMEHDADMSVAAVPYSVSVPYGIMDLDGRELRGMIEKPTFSYYANGGIYLIKKEMLGYIPDGEHFDATDLVDLLIRKGHRVIRFPINGTWIDIGNLQEYQKANDLVKHIM